MTDQETIYNEIKHLIKFNSSYDKIKDLIKSIGIEYLSHPDSNITDWGKDFPRYLHLYGLCFSEGHGIFDLLRKSITIPLSGFDMVYMTIAGVFWRYYNNIGIVNDAICQLKKSDIYNQMNNIPYTEELVKLLEDSSVTRQYGQFNRYGKELGYFNISWLVDPSTYDNLIDCKKIDVKHIYNMCNSVTYSKKKLTDDFDFEYFKKNIKIIEKHDECPTELHSSSTIELRSSSTEWRCIEIINNSSFSSYIYIGYVFLHEDQIDSYLKNHKDISYEKQIIYKLEPELIKQLQQKGIIPE
jgi:hypothetical protein